MNYSTFLILESLGGTSIYGIPPHVVVHEKNIMCQDIDVEDSGKPISIYNAYVLNRSEVDEILVATNTTLPKNLMSVVNCKGLSDYITRIPKPKEGGNSRRRR